MGCYKLKMTDQRLLIDRNGLDDELINNPSLVQQVCDECAEAIAQRDYLKEMLEVVDAELDAEIREEFLSTNKSKVTEAVIESAIKTHKRHKDAFKKYNDAKLAAAKAAALERAVSVRSDALKELSKLFAAGYFAIDSTRRSVEYKEAGYDKLRERLASRRKEIGR